MGHTSKFSPAKVQVGSISVPYASRQVNQRILLYSAINAKWKNTKKIVIVIITMTITTRNSACHPSVGLVIDDTNRTLQKYPKMPRPMTFGETFASQLHYLAEQNRSHRRNIPTLIQISSHFTQNSTSMLHACMGVSKNGPTPKWMGKKNGKPFF